MNNPSEEGGTLLDHIFTKRIEPAPVLRILDEAQSLQVDGRQTVRTHLSDHYGLKMEVRRELSLE